MKYYILSVKHTSPQDDFFTLWRGGNAGYTETLHGAGEYDKIVDGYHNTEANLPFPTTTMLSHGLNRDGELCVLNNRANRRVLGLEVKKGKMMISEKKFQKNLENGFP